MHGRGQIGHNNEPSTSDFAKDDDDTANGESAVEYDVPASGRAAITQAVPRRPSSIAVASMAPSVPTMRSRVTVVCAECKKQKLRCDRRIPCESCVKRNTVQRCIYTPAAIEKVDMTSINNRLRVVEGSLNALGVPTQAYQQPHVVPSSQPQLNLQQAGVLPFLSTGGMGFALPGAQIATLPVNSGTQRTTSSSEIVCNPDLNAPPAQVLAVTDDARCASTVAPLDGVAELWVREVIEQSGHLSPLSPSRSQQAVESSQGLFQSPRGNMVSNKHLRLNLQPIDRATTGGVPAFGCRTRKALEARQWLELHAGLSVSSEPATGDVSRPLSETVAGLTQSASATAVDSLSDLHASLTNQLLSQFPSRCIRREMLVRLGTAYLIEGFTAVPFRAFCTAIEALFSPMSEEHIELADTSARSPMPMLSTVAEAAAGLAVGALIWATERSAARTAKNEVLRRVVLRTMEPFVTGGRVDSVDAEGGLERPKVETAFALYRLAQLALSIHMARHGHAAQDIAVIHTRLLSAHYLLLAHSTSSEFPDSILPPELPPLVGSLIWEARAMGLGIDPDEFDCPDEVRGGPSRGLGIDGPVLESFVKQEDGDEDSVCHPRGKKMSLFMKEVRRRMWWWVIWLDMFVSDSYGYKATILPGEYSTRLPAVVDDTCFRPDSVVLPLPDDTCLERNNTFYIAQLRLLEMAMHAPLRAFRSGSVPSSTEDARTVAMATAQKLADEMLQWLEELPERFKLVDGAEFTVTFSQSPMTPLRPPSEVEEERQVAEAILTSQRCAMTLHGCHVLVRIFTPRSMSASTSSRQPGASLGLGSKVVPADRQFAGLKAIQPALAVVHAAEIQIAYAPDLAQGTHMMYMFPRRVFDAAVVLAHTAIQQPLYTASIVIEAVRSARDILSRILSYSATRDDSGSDREIEAVRVIDALLRRAEKAKAQNTPIMAGMKRKRDDSESEASRFDGPFRFPFFGTGIVNARPLSLQMATPYFVTEERPEMQRPVSQPSSQTNTYSTSATRKDESRTQQPTDVVLGHRGRNVPAASIRQRVRDRREDHTSDGSRAALTPADTSFRTMPSFLVTSESSSQQTGPSASPSSSAFPSESMSASPISPAPQYDVNHGSRQTNAAYPYRADGFAPDAHSTGVAPPLQGPPTLQTPYHYPVAHFASPRYHPSMPQQQHHSGELPLIENSVGASSRDAPQYGPDLMHPVPAGQLRHENDASAGAQHWAGESFSDQDHRPLTAPSPHPTGMFPPDHHPQQDHSGAWTSGENINSDSLATPWNMGLFNNWNRDSQ